MQTGLRVVLLSHTPDPEQVVATAAKLCYSDADIGVLTKRIGEGDTGKFITGLMRMGHLSPIEHASFTFGVEGISRACSHQLVRHRLASYSQQSQRYVGEEGGLDYIIPPSIGQDETLRGYFVAFMEEAQAAYARILKRLNEKGLKGEAANQDARFVLPNAAETKILITMNARELLHFFRQRCCQRAQWEIRNLAGDMLGLVKSVAPTIFAEAGPACVSGACPEGRYSCGRADDVRASFREMKTDAGAEK
ncbi:MAG: FAD-dependent thymidylate synthase [Syntrophorhabdales bacterium]|jgi:thymidylate synthase (FAD)